MLKKPCIYKMFHVKHFIDTRFFSMRTKYKDKSIRSINLAAI